MQTYIDNGDGTISIDGMTIPKDGGNRHYQEYLKLQAAGEVTLVEPMVDVAMLKSAACSRIDAKAETLRQGVLTPGSGQAAEYYLTYAEAVSYLPLVLAGKTPTDTDYPFLLAEQAALAATAGAVTLTSVATAIMSDVGASKTALAAIKEARRKGKLAVRAAGNASLVASAEAAVVWPDKR